ncbi:MAG: hypothetical protein ACKVOO_03160 [Burkholderiaceae bacterium]
MNEAEPVPSTLTPHSGPQAGAWSKVRASVAAGELAPGQGAALLGAIGTLARVAEVDELAAASQHWIN